MIFRFRSLMFITALIAGLATSYSVFAEAVFDRLDGKGPSGKRVDVIEWDGNLEIHVYPKGSLVGLSAKLDDREEGKKVMVVGYRLAKGAKPLIRRAILGVPFTANVMGFIDRSEPDFDKLAISNQNLAKPWAPYKLDPAPAQWGPEGSDREFSNPQQPTLTDATSPNSEVAPEPAQKRTRGGSRNPASVPTKVTPPTEETDSLNHFNW
jgi:hypothetical protein